jgi:DnaJ-class molecular chaperone
MLDHFMLYVPLQGQASWDQAQEFEDIFAQFFGGGGRGAAFRAGGFSFGGFTPRGPDIQARIRCVASAHACSADFV